MSLARDIIKALEQGAATITPPDRRRVVSRGPCKANAEDFETVTAALRKLTRCKPGKEWIWPWRSVHHYSNAELAHKQAQYAYNCARSVGVKITLRKMKVGLVIKLK